jgi:hypothetical protein
VRQNKKRESWKNYNGVWVSGMECVWKEKEKVVVWHYGGGMEWKYLFARGASIT